MRIALVCGSPKAKESGSKWLLNYVAKHFGTEVEVVNVHLHKAAKPDTAQLEALSNADAWIVAFPLYVDGVPGHLLYALRELEKAGLTNPNRHIYGICNCGFYEGAQNEPALDVLKNWAVKCGYVWGGAVGFGGGGGTLSYAGMGKFGQILMGPVPKALASLAKAAEQGQVMESVYPTVALPRWIYQFCAHDGWRKKIKANGGKVEDLERQF